MALKRLELGHGFIEAFGRDLFYQDLNVESSYLDTETGEIIWIYKDGEDAELPSEIPEEENTANQKRVKDNPERYLEVKGLDHGEHHGILFEFLDSEWTEDEELRRKANDAYSGSIGRWKEDVNDDDAVRSYCDYRDHIIESMAEEFLRKNGIEPVWK